MARARAVRERPAREKGEEAAGGACAVRERGPAGGAREGERRRAARSTDGERERAPFF